VIAVVLIAHAHIARETKLAVEHILGAQCAFEAIDIPDSSMSKEEQTRLQQLMKAMDMGQGVLLMVDLLGATPCNITFGVPSSDGDVAVVAGFSLPAVIKAITLRQENITLQVLAATSIASGKQYMCLASDVQRRRARR